MPILSRCKHSSMMGGIGGVHSFMHCARPRGYGCYGVSEGFRSPYCHLLAFWESSQVTVIFMLEQTCRCSAQIGLVIFKATIEQGKIINSAGCKRQSQKQFVFEWQILNCDDSSKFAWRSSPSVSMHPTCGIGWWNIGVWSSELG